MDRKQKTQKNHNEKAEKALKRREKGTQMFKRLQSVIEAVLRYNDYAVVICNMEMLILLMMLWPSEPSSPPPSLISMFTIGYLNLLVIKQIIV